MFHHLLGSPVMLQKQKMHLLLELLQTCRHISICASYFVLPLASLMLLEMLHLLEKLNTLSKVHKADSRSSRNICYDSQRWPLF